MPPPHPPEFRRRAVELARERAKPITQIAADIGISAACASGSLAPTSTRATKKAFPPPSGTSWSASAGRAGCCAWRGDPGKAAAFFAAETAIGRAEL